jgi:hypothetical protein
LEAGCFGSLRLRDRWRSGNPLPNMGALKG